MASTPNKSLEEELQVVQETLAREREEWKQLQQEYESLLEGKQQTIQELYTQVKEAQAPPPRPPEEEDLFALQRELEQQRDQLKQDEQSLMAQMRDMEVQMAKDRAEIARQRNDLQRLHNEMKRELENVSRDAQLRDKLAPLYKLQEELGRRRGDSGSGVRPRPSAEPPVAAPPESGATPAKEPSQKSGFFRRLFGRDQG